MRNQIVILSIILITLMQIGCAKMGAPTGGVKDSIPPVMIDASPLNKSVSFSSKKATIYFDEYIKFTNLNTQLIISPPMEKKPTIKPEFSVSKKIEIEFLSPLKENTTYTINFGNSIVDNNENNELGKFSYVFSTGTYIDSLSISGSIADPLSDEEIENITIMAYKNANDTLVGNFTPNYVTNTLKTSEYTLENLSEANYKVIAVEDLNSNYKYDKGLERIGFLDNEIDLKPSKDSLSNKSYDFTLFKESKNNKIIRPIQTSGHLFILGYQGKEIPKVSAKGINKNDYLVSKPNEKDSLYFWYKNTPLDSIFFEIKQDTVIKKFTKKPRELKIDSLIINYNLKGTFHPNDSLLLSSNIPIDFINRDSIVVLEQDSIPIDYTITNNPEKQNIHLDFKRKSNRLYSINLKNTAFTDILNQTSGEQTIQLKTIDPEDYGEIILSIDNPKGINLIIELSMDKFATKYVKTSNNSKNVSFSNLTKGKYQVRVISDLNNNNRFDNGNFKLHLQPEPIYNLNKEIILRANSEVNEIIKF